MVHIRINLNDDGTANYYRWVPATPEPGCVLEEWEGEYDFANPILPREAMKLLSQGATIDLTVVDPDNSDIVCTNLDLLQLTAL